MLRDHSQLILSFLHFADNKYCDLLDPQRDRLYKMRPLMESLLSKFQEAYTP